VRKERPEASPFRHPRGVHEVSLARDAPPIKRREDLAPPRLFTHLRAAKRPRASCRCKSEPTDARTLLRSMGKSSQTNRRTGGILSCRCLRRRASSDMSRT
jgi:hypothetical protein